MTYNVTYAATTSEITKSRLDRPMYMITIIIIITNALHEMQTRSSNENSVCPSVKRVHCDKTEEKSVKIFYNLV